ncbi:hypothetical protein EBZ38_03835 [bacterium]|nr:hypothetical protein [bacterium]NDD83398.1 hypothetical protein [bacterium]
MNDSKMSDVYKIVPKHSEFETAVSATPTAQKSLHFEDLGRGKVGVREVLRENERPVLELNAVKRNHEQRHGVMGKQIADITHSAAARWKDLYGFDVYTANLNDPVQKRMLDKLLALNPEYKTT